MRAFLIFGVLAFAGCASTPPSPSSAIPEAAGDQAAASALRFVHAPSSGKAVRSDRLDSPYWRKHLSEARRL